MGRIQRKFLLVLSILVVGVVSITGLVAQSELRDHTRSEIEDSLVNRADLVAELLAGSTFVAASPVDLKAAVDRASRAADARVTLIGVDGRVVVDSDLELSELSGVENHGSRPEVQQAYGGEVGSSTRRSATVGREMLYVAVPSRRDAAGSVVRLSVDLDHIASAVAELRRELLLSTLIGVLLTFPLSLLLVGYFGKPLDEIQRVLEGMREGASDDRIHWWSRDELGSRGTAINQAVEGIRSRMTESAHEKEQLEAVLAAMVEGVLVLDERGRVALANPRLRELLGLWGTIEGRPWFELIRNPQAVDALKLALESRELVAVELEGVGAGNRILLLHAVGFPSQGPRAGTVAVLHDLTDIRHADNVRRDFVANASHELKTPLTAIRGFAETLLSNDASPQEVEQYISVISRNADRMNSLVEDLLTLSRIESGTGKLESLPVDLHEVTRLLLGDLSQRLEAASLAARIVGEGDAIALADRRAVEQVLSNLIDNAIKYSDPGGELVVTIDQSSSSSQRHALRVSVQDAGQGISPADQARIFERFYRVDAARSRALGGTGLGLSIVKHLVHAMGGEVRVESKVGEGSRFSFSIPSIAPAQSADS